MQGHGDPSRPPGDAGAGGAPVGGRSDPHPSPYDPPTLSHGLTMAAPGRDTLPERIGRYRVLSVLGEGGFGIVYQAQQEEPVRRRVALKVLKPGMDSRQVLARFQAEQQALALMDHPGVARVFDGGVTEQGRAYFAMEYVPGAPITEYCDLHRLDTRARIELFILVCQAVQHAHSKGVIHRDLKPSNVLVEVADGTPTPKVIDFGVAKAVNRNLTDRTLHTEMGQLIGTPEYMSPEQAEMTGLDIDTRTDVYALGVLLYELLTGALPFDPRSLRAKGFVEIQRIIREAEPPKPSTRLGSLAADDAAARATAHRRQTELSDLVRQLRGDLDWIIMKAMAKDRTRRYETTAQFAEDLRRFLTSQPVLARPPSVMYLSRKFVARHRWPIAAAAVALAMLAGGLVSTSILYSQAVEARAETQRKNEELQRQRDAAERSRADAEAARRVAEFQTYLTNVSIADAAVAADDYGWARARLEQSPAAMRDWEWRYLRSCTDRARHVIALPPGEALLAYSADSRRLLVAAPDGSLHLIDAATGRTERRSAPGGPAALAMAQGPGGAAIVLALADGSVVERDGRTLEPRRVLRPPQDVLVQHKSAEAAAKAGVGQRYAEARAVSLALTPDGQTVALGFADGTIRLLRAADGKEIASMLASTLRRQGVRDLAFDAAGRRLVSVTEVAAQVWDAGTGRPVSSVPAFMPGYGSTLTPDGRALAVMNPLTALIQLWTTDDNRRRLVLATLSSRVDPRGHVMQLNASGTRAAISLGDGTIQVWNVEPPEQTPADGVLRERERLVATLPGHAAPVNAIAFRPDRAGMASVSTDGQLRLWDGDLLGRAVVRQRSGDAGDPLTLGNGRIAFRDEGRLRVLDAVTRAEVGAVPIANERACFDPGSGDLLLVRDGKVLSRYAGDTLRLREQVGAADALPGRLRLALRARADDPGARCEVVDQATGRVIARLAGGVAITPSPSGVRGEISASGQVAAVRPRDDLVEFYALPSGEQLGVATVPSGARVIAMSNDGRSAAVLDGGRGVLLIETQGARLRKRIDAGTSPVDASFSPDGRRLAVLLADGTVRLLEADGLTEMLVLRSGAIQPQVVAFSPDGAVIAIAGPQDVVAWTVPPPASPAGGP